MKINPTAAARKVAYPTLAAMAAVVAISACQQQPQRLVGKYPASAPRRNVNKPAPDTPTQEPLRMPGVRLISQKGESPSAD